MSRAVVTAGDRRAFSKAPSLISVAMAEAGAQVQLLSANTAGKALRSHFSPFLAFCLIPFIFPFPTKGTQIGQESWPH